MVGRDRSVTEDENSEGSVHRENDLRLYCWMIELWRMVDKTPHDFYSRFPRPKKRAYSRPASGRNYSITNCAIKLIVDCIGAVATSGWPQHVSGENYLRHSSSVKIFKWPCPAYCRIENEILKLGNLNLEVECIGITVVFPESNILPKSVFSLWLLPSCLLRRNGCFRQDVAQRIT